MKFIVLNGPNLNLLGSRDKNHYGAFSLSDIELLLKKEYPDDYFEFYQSNHEGELIDRVQKAEAFFDGIIINPGGYAHTSVAIKDALTESKIPKIEVHLSNLSSRENYRQICLTASSCNGYLSGFKADGYLAAVYLLKRLIGDKES
ncbi:MAG: type II 3-dehydroquinate dehydratase [Clostridiales bacterium]